LKKPHVSFVSVFEKALCFLCKNTKETWVFSETEWVLYCRILLQSKRLYWTEDIWFKLGFFQPFYSLSEKLWKKNLFYSTDSATVQFIPPNSPFSLLVHLAVTMPAVQSCRSCTHTRGRQEHLPSKRKVTALSQSQWFKKNFIFLFLSFSRSSKLFLQYSCDNYVSVSCAIAIAKINVKVFF